MKIMNSFDDDVVDDKNTSVDINNLFDGILVSEERLIKKSYTDGWSKGCIDGRREGYQLGYSQGVKLGEELAQIYSMVVVLQQLKHSSTQIIRLLEKLREAIDNFPRSNDPNIDIITLLKNIYTSYKRLCAMLKINPIFDLTLLKKRDLSF